MVLLIICWLIHQVLKNLKMKNINPINVWMLGKTVTASILNAYVINDDLTANA